MEQRSRAGNGRVVHGGLRGRVERVSYPYLVKLHEIPRWLLVGSLVVLLLGGVLGPRWVGTACLAVVVAFFGWLTYLAWPEGGPARKALRVGALAVAVGAALIRLTTG